MVAVDTEDQTVVVTKKKSRTKEPRLYRVFLLNDDYTTMDFVVYILEAVFQKPPGEAHHIMLEVHQKGKGIAGIYTREVAETKIALVHLKAKQQEFPLKCTMEPN